MSVILFRRENSVISMIYHYFTHHIPYGNHLVLYCDNCPGQNKNQTMLAFLAYMVKIKKYFASVELNFMISGHTKFTPDGNFGNIKKFIKSHNCYSVLDLVGESGMIRESSQNNYEISYSDPHSMESNFDWYDWKSFLKQKFYPCTGIQEWHTVRIEEHGNDIQVANHVGDVFNSYHIMKENIDLPEFPGKVQPDGLAEDRIKYLKFFENFVIDHHREYISGDY
jgi:hypothetical protein